MVRIKIKADITTDGWDAYRISNHPEYLSDLLLGEIADLLKIKQKQKENLKESGLIKVHVEIVDDGSTRILHNEA